jgi:hypothetical protein
MWINIIHSDKEDYEVVVATMEAEHVHEIRQWKEEFNKADDA